MTNIIGFLRSDITFSDHVSINELSFFPRLITTEVGVAELPDCILFSEPEDWERFDPHTYTTEPFPSWVAFFEVLRIGNNFSSLAIEDRDPTDTSLDALLAPLRHSGGIEAPTFGRRMAIVSFDEKRIDRRVEKSEAKIRRALGANAEAVWHADQLIAFCFIDNRSVQDISEGLERFADDQVTDYIIVEPLEMAAPHPSDISPLSRWVAGGFRERLR